MPRGKTSLPTEKAKCASRSVAESARGISQKGPVGSRALAGSCGLPGPGQLGLGPTGLQSPAQGVFPPALSVLLLPPGESSIRFCQTVFGECGLCHRLEREGDCHCPPPLTAHSPAGQGRPFEPALDTGVRTTDSEPWVQGLNAALLTASSGVWLLYLGFFAS